MEILARNPSAGKRSGQNSPPTQQKPRNRRTGQKSDFLPVVESGPLTLVYREFDDLPVETGIPGYPREVIAQLPYKRPINGCARPVKIPRRAVVVAVRNLAGEIVGLHGASGEWFTGRRLHFANPIRAQYTGEFEIHADTIAADVAAFQRNTACIGLNGLSHDDLRLAIAHLRGVRLVSGEARAVAA